MGEPRVSPGSVPLRRTASDALVLVESSSPESDDSDIPCAQPRDDIGGFSQLVDLSPPEEEGASSLAHDPSLDGPVTNNEYSSQDTDTATQATEVLSDQEQPVSSGPRNALRNQNNKAWRRRAPQSDAPPQQLLDRPPLPPPVGDYYVLSPTQQPTQQPDSPLDDDPQGAAGHESHPSRSSPDHSLKVGLPDTQQDSPPVTATASTASTLPVTISPRDIPPAVTPVHSNERVRSYKKRRTASTRRSKDPDVVDSSENDSDYTIPDITTTGKRKRGSRSAPSTNSVKKRGTSSSPPVSNPCRILALWEHDEHYYPGTVIECLGSSMYNIRFDDGNQSIAALGRLRRCELRHGDVVSARDKTRWQRGKVVSANGQNPDSTIYIEGERQKSACFTLQKIRIPAALIDSTWDDRAVTQTALPPEPVPHTGRPKRKASGRKRLPTISTTPSTSIRYHGATIEGTGFILTLSNHDTSAKREDIESLISANGGVLFDDWSDIVCHPHARESTKQRWVLERSCIEYSFPKDVHCILLISDGHSSKPKYLTALALGVPCVALNFLEAWANGDPSLDLSHYLLPQGTYDHTLVSQQIDLGWLKRGNIEAIKQNPIPRKMFSGMDLLLFGKDINLPAVKGKQTNLVTPIPPILMAMGAESVETVRDINQSLKDLDNYDYIIAKDESDIADKKVLGTPLQHLVLWSWVKESLVLGREAPRPSAKPTET